MSILTAQPVAPVVNAFSFRERWVLVLLAAVSACGVGVVSERVGWPTELGFSRSITHAAHRGAALTVIGVAIVAGVTLGTLLLGRLRYEAGLFTAACGLAALASRVGTVGAALRTTENPKLYVALCADTVALMAVVTVGWLLLKFFAAVSLARPNAPRRGNPLELIAATVVQALVTALFLLLFARGDAMKQVMAATFVAALLGALAAHQTVPVGTSAPFWGGTMLVGVVAFAWASIHPNGWQIGMAANPLAAVPPLAYASMGTAGAVLGYWVSERWKAMEPAGDEPADLLDDGEAVK